MKLIIDIPEDVYTRLFDNGIQDNEIAVDDICEMARTLRLGTPIPDNATNEKAIDDIKVGDEVIVQVDKIGFVTGFDVLFDRVYVTTKDGWSDAFGKSFVKKTGRHFDEIENVLKQMRKGDKDDK